MDWMEDSLKWLETWRSIRHARPASSQQNRKDAGERDLALCQSMVEACFMSEDYIEGRTAFMEKRKPVFQGR